MTESINPGLAGLLTFVALIGAFAIIFFGMRSP